MDLCMYVKLGRKAWIKLEQACGNKFSLVLAFLKNIDEVCAGIIIFKIYHWGKYNVCSIYVGIRDVTYRHLKWHSVPKKVADPCSSSKERPSYKLTCWVCSFKLLPYDLNIYCTTIFWSVGDGTLGRFQNLEHTRKNLQDYYQVSYLPVNQIAYSHSLFDANNHGRVIRANLSKLENKRKHFAPCKKMARISATHKCVSIS